jgi:F-type H+-transporting ATPase subunit b
MPQFDPSIYPSQIFWLLVCFSFLVWFVRGIFFPRMTKVFDERERCIQDDLWQCKKMSTECSAILRDYGAELNKSKEKAIDSREQLLKGFDAKKAAKVQIAQKHFLARKVALERESQLSVDVPVRFQNVLLASVGERGGGVSGASEGLNWRGRSSEPPGAECLERQDAECLEGQERGVASEPPVATCLERREAECLEGQGRGRPDGNEGVMCGVWHD